MGTVRVLDIGAQASARIGSRYQVDALARRTTREPLNRYQPIREEWAHAFRPRMDARLGKENTDPLVLGFPEHEFIPRAPDGGEPLPGTGDHLYVHLGFNPPTLPQQTPRTAARPIPYPVRLLSLHIHLSTMSAAQFVVTVTMPPLRFNWKRYHHSAASFALMPPTTIPLDYDLLSPALLRIGHEDITAPGTFARATFFTALLTYRHIDAPRRP